MALFSSPEMRDAMRNAPPEVQQALTNAGFGWNTQEFPSSRVPGTFFEFRGQYT